jgi:hypothetical protein
MQSVAKLQTALKTFGEFARRVADKPDAVGALQRKWHALFGQDLSTASAESFLQHYRKLNTMRMRGGTRNRRAGGRARTMRGGMAPLDHTMAPPAYTASPGMIGVYGNFPTEYGANPAAIDSMDRYFGSALQQGCGTENSSLTPPVDMGSNRVHFGGARRRAQRRATRRRVSRKHRKTARKYRAKGGDMRYYLATVPPSFVQNATSAFAGVAGPAAADPTVRAWDYVGGTATPINPGTSTQIASTFSNLAQFGL